jgi:hypothetical protein
METQEAITAIIKELERATKINEPFHSAHEGFAVLLEEVDELKAEVWKKIYRRDRHQMIEEAVQVGAMAIRFLMDVC